jgi:hypothetical protein
MTAMKAMALKMAKVRDSMATADFAGSRWKFGPPRRAVMGWWRSQRDNGQERWEGGIPQ